MPTSLASGSQVTTVGTEHTLATNTSGVTFVLSVDLNALAAADVVELRLYTKVKSSSTERLAWCRHYKGVQQEPNKYTIPIPADVSLRATLKQVVGTSVTIDWSLLAI